jgi:hypothetical protein
MSCLTGFPTGVHMTRRLRGEAPRPCSHCGEKKPIDSYTCPQRGESEENLLWNAPVQFCKECTPEMLRHLFHFHVDS